MQCIGLLNWLKVPYVFREDNFGFSAFPLCFMCTGVIKNTRFQTGARLGSKFTGKYIRIHSLSYLRQPCVLPVCGQVFSARSPHPE